MRRVVWTLLTVLYAVAPLAEAQPQDCASLPSSAQRTRTCNPQRECLAQVERTLKGPALQSGRRDCQRLPCSGTCFGPETYSPHADCRERQRRR